MIEQSPEQVSSPTAVTGGLSPVAPLARTQPITPPMTPNGNLVPTTLPTLPPTVIPTQLPPKTINSPNTTGEPLAGFNALRFAPAADAPAQTTFPAGIEEIFAIWDYDGMQAGDRIRRIWFRDGQIWLTREEDWNWGKYGRTGTVLDNSVYDYEGSGLEPATYYLQLYVNDSLQEEATFVVLSP